jgi:pimeloyl-ACP methyl ester carboxylesterase
MKKLRNLYFFLWLLFPFLTTAQGTWASYSAQLPTKEYWGHKFKFSASVKTGDLDDSSSAKIWARVDRAQGKNAFFYNMDDKPIKNKEWKTYTIEGVIDSNTTKLAFGTLTDFNGQFYYDDMRLDIETDKNTWKTVYKNDFQQDKLDLEAGIQMETSKGLFGRYYGINDLFKTNLEKSGSNQYLKIESKDVIDFGNNKKTGKYAEVNGIKLYYETYGSGLPLLILQGLTADIQRLSHCYPELMKKYQIITVDNRGTGKSTDTDEPFTYEKMASDINQLLDQLHIDSALVLSVQDGMVGLLLAKDYPKKVKKLFAFGLRLQQDSSAVKQSVIAAYEKFMKETQDPKIKKVGALVSRRDYPNMPFSELSSIKAPVLVMGVDKGPNVKEHVLKIYQTLPNGQFCYLPGTASDIIFKKSAMFLMIMKDFFEE